MVQILMMLPWSRHGEKASGRCRVKSAGSPEAKLRRVELKGTRELSIMFLKETGRIVHIIPLML